MELTSCHYISLYSLHLASIPHTPVRFFHLLSALDSIKKFFSSARGGNLLSSSLGGLEKKVEEYETCLWGFIDKHGITYVCGGICCMWLWYYVSTVPECLFYMFLMFTEGNRQKEDC